MIMEQYDTVEPIGIVIRNTAGYIDVVASASDTTSVRVEGVDADAFTVDFTDGVLTVVAPEMSANRRVFLGGLVVIQGRWNMGAFDQTRDTMVTIAAPTGSTLDVKTGSGPVRVAGPFGESSIRGGSGDIAIEQVAAPLTLKVGSGDIAVERVLAPCTIGTGSGGVRVGTLGAPVRTKVGSGNVTIDELSDELRATAGSGNLTIARARRGGVRYESASGNVTIGVEPGTPTWTELTSLTGHVRSDLPPVGEPEPGTDHLELRVRVGSGNIVLRQA
jgi:hypothetical protein